MRHVRAARVTRRIIAASRNHTHTEEAGGFLRACSSALLTLGQLPPTGSDHAFAAWSSTGVRGFAAQPQRTDEAQSDAADQSVVGDAFDAEASEVTDGPLKLYREGRASKLFREDPGQEHTVRMLQKLYDDLRVFYPVKRRRSGLTVVDSFDGSSEGGGGWWSNLLGAGSGDSSQQSTGSSSVPKGLYMYGGVGVGKTMLMDLLVLSAPPEFQLRRTHFHDFMLDVHARLQARRTSKDALIQVADDLAAQMRVLALDEFFVTDVADAVILNRLFGRLWDKGVVLVSTSNRKPDALYEGGLQRVLFLPFIDRLKAACVCHNMASGTDYRKLAQHSRGMYFIDDTREQELQQTFLDLTNNNPVEKKTLTVQMGRKLQIAKAGGCIAYLSFEELCGRPVAAADYIALADAYHSIALSGVPVVTAANRPAAYRFMILIDVLYEHRIRLFCSAEAEPFELFQNVVAHAEAKQMGDAGGNLVVDDNLGFTKDRTISRLVEMSSREYLVQHAERHAPELLLALNDRKANPKSAQQSRHERGGLRSSYS